MYGGDNGIFVFGSKILPDVHIDALSCLPLELSWKIFSYLDGRTLRTACDVCKIWKRRILSCKRLRSRLNMFELSLLLGSANMAKYYLKNRRKLKKVKKKNNYLPVAENRVLSPLNTSQSTSIMPIIRKRKAEDVTIHSKRMKLF